MRATASVVIPAKESRPTVELGDITLTLYGPPKIGKTTLASQFPAAAFICTEPGQRFVRVRRIEFDGKPYVSGWEQFTGAISVLQKAADIRTIVIDTVDGLYQLCLAAVCSELNISHPEDLPRGKAWGRIGVVWAEAITRLCNAGKGVVFVSHTAEREYNNGVETAQKTGPAIPVTGWRAVNALSDLIFYYGFTRAKVKGEDGKVRSKMVRALYTKPTSDIEAGDRTHLFPPVMRMPAGKEYERLAAEFVTVTEKLRDVAKGASNG